MTVAGRSNPRGAANRPARLTLEQIEAILQTTKDLSGAAHRLALARATRSSYRDHDLRWDHTGRNGHYAPINWSGP